MSNRGLAIVGFMIFMIAFLWEMESLQDRVAYSGHVNVQAPQCPGGPELRRLETYVFMVYAELGLHNELTALDLRQTHPQQAAEVRYHQFKTLASQMRSAQGLLKFWSMREVFGAEYDALKARYVAEHPDTPLPADTAGPAPSPSP